MKIGILTFVGTQSHGACLQAYALKEAIKELGGDADVINYHCAKIDAVKTDKLILKGKSIKKRVGTILKRPIYKKRFGKFEAFETEFLGLGQTVTKEEMGSLYERIIVGSDQIWNTEITGNDFTYFLDSISDSSRKFSYAASLGIDAFPRSLEEKCLSMVKDFSRINVREESLKNYLNSKIDREISCVIDPTQLISYDKWNRIAGDTPIESGDYMFVHAPDESDAEWENIYRIAIENNLKIIYQTNRIYRKKGCKCLYSVSPTEYLNYVKFSKYVVTGSFHTLSFSLIFGRSFLCTDSMIKGRNSRLNNLLEIAGCSERMTYNTDNVRNAPIGYEKVWQRLRSAADYSRQKLNEMLK